MAIDTTGVKAGRDGDRLDCLAGIRFDTIGDFLAAFPYIEWHRTHSFYLLGLRYRALGVAAELFMCLLIHPIYYLFVSLSVDTQRAYRNRPLSEEQKAHNTERSRTRANVEHIFGIMTMTMGGKLVRSIGLASVKTQLGLKNLTFNLQRYVFWQKQEMLEAAA